MIGLDTNVLVRAATNDDLEQSAAARERLSALTNANPAFVSHVVLVEMWWVLTQVYGQPAAKVHSYLTSMCETVTIVIQDRDLVRSALDAVFERNADFADALIVAVAKSNGCAQVETFDEKAIRRAGMRELALS